MIRAIGLTVLRGYAQLLKTKVGMAHTTDVWMNRNLPRKTDDVKRFRETVVKEKVLVKRFSDRTDVWLGTFSRWVRI